MRRDGGEALVYESNSEVRCGRGQPRGEAPSVGGRRGVATAQRQRQAHDRLDRVELGGVPQDLADVAVTARHGRDREREHSVWVAARHPDADRADVDSEPDAVTNVELSHAERNEAA